MLWRVVIAAVVAATSLVLIVRTRRRVVVVDVQGPSMEPTLYDGDRVLVRRAPLTALRTGDLVVVARPQSHEFATVGPWVIKRVAAVPGEQIPPVIRHSWDENEYIDFAGALVPEGRLLLLGDNPTHSGDSRHWGFATGDAVLGVVTRPMRARTT
ncbi:S26 family signal peptidase [Kribbella albertanoniae]|uniref:Signal peptidase I n=1 Tax=Kribbella albertanoniae TaxID=1266829 RepID=A0A4R4Q1C3_9ACTN|nr:signal peptidase I [Kribbella albertanoniae]TDC28720.1 signal peptidase I [Kribbella albertanoniae]